MFENETVDLKCPKCGHINTLAVSEFEQHNEARFVCEGCNTAVKVEASQFHDRLAEVRREVEELEREARPPKAPARPRKGDFQI